MSLFLAALTLSLLVPDCLRLGRFLLSRPLVIGAAIGQVMGQGALGVWFGLFFEVIALQDELSEDKTSLSPAIAAGSAMLLYAPPHQAPFQFVIPAGLLIGWLHRSAEQRVRRRHELISSDGGLWAHWAVTAGVLLITLYVIKPALPWCWQKLPRFAIEGLVFASNYSFYLTAAALIQLLVAPESAKRIPRDQPDSASRTPACHPSIHGIQEALAPIAAGMDRALEEKIAHAPAEEKAVLTEKLSVLKSEADALLKEIVGSLGPSFGAFCAVALMALMGTLYLFDSTAYTYSSFSVLFYLLLCNIPLLALHRSGYAWGYEWKEETPAMLKLLPLWSGVLWLRRAGTALALYWAIPMFNLSQHRGIKPVFAFAGFFALLSLRLSPIQIYAALCALGGLGWLAGF